LALEYEERRQRDLLLDGGKVVQETLLWNPDRACTESMRGKEEAHDYRYFPEPDLVPVLIDEAWIERMQAGLPELPDARCARFAAQYGLSEQEAGCSPPPGSLPIISRRPAPSTPTRRNSATGSVPNSCANSRPRRSAPAGWPRRSWRGC